MNPKFTGYTPLSTTYKSYSTDGTKVNPYNPDGSLNPKFTGYTPLSTTYKTYSTDGKTYSADGTKLNPYNPDGSLNPKFTGYTPLSTTYKSYSSDSSTVPDGDKFTGYRALSTSYSPLSTTHVSLSSDGTTVPTGDKFTGYTPFSTTYHPYSSDGTTVPTSDKFTGYAPYSTSYTPLSTTYHYYGDVDEDTPVIPVAPTSDNSVAATLPASSLIGGTSPTSDKLPQTGEDGEESQGLALLGLSMLALALGMSVVGKKRKQKEIVDEPVIG